MSEGSTPFLCFFVLATVVLRNAVISRVLAWFWVGFGKIAFFYDTVFGILGILDFLRFFLGCCYFSSFGLVLSGLGIIVCVCVTSGFCFEVVEFCCCDACMTMAMMM